MNKFALKLQPLLVGLLVESITACASQTAQVLPTEQLEPSRVSETTIAVPADTNTFEPTLTPSPTEEIDETSTPLPTLEVTPNAQGYPTVLDPMGFRLVRIPPGTFQMGLSPFQAEWVCEQWKEERPDCSELLDYNYTLHQVTLTYHFWIDVYEASNDDYQRCEEDLGCSAPHYVDKVNNGETYYGNSLYSNYPFIDAYWSDADDYCQWRGGRLPTEAEWEYAARGTDGRLWPWGDSLPEVEQANFKPYVQHPSLNSPRPIDDESFSNGLSPFGIVAMAGNAGEWVYDWYAPYPSEAVVDPVNESGDYRIMRGGLYIFGPVEMMTTHRYIREPGKSFSQAGIRCVFDEVPR